MDQKILTECENTKNYDALKKEVYEESRKIIKDLKEYLNIIPGDESIIYRDLIGTNINNLKFSVKITSSKIWKFSKTELKEIFNSIIKKYDLIHEVKWIEQKSFLSIRFHIYFLFSEL